MVEIIVQQDRKIELIVNNIANVPGENNHSHEANTQADGVDGVVISLDVIDSFGDSTDHNDDALPEDNLTSQLYDTQDKRATLTDKSRSTDNPCVFTIKQGKEEGIIISSSALPGTYHWKAKAAPYDDSNYMDVTFLGAEIGGLNISIYRVGMARPSNLMGKDKESLLLSNTYRFVLWRDSNKDGVFRRVEKLTDEGMVQYDYKWGFISRSINGEMGAQVNTSNEDIMIPAINHEAAQAYGAQAGDGLQGYGLRVLYTKK